MIGDSLSHWHTYTCEWMPEYIKWYCDGNIVNEYHNPDSIPSHHLALKANYAIDHYALQQQDEDWRPVWRGSDNMVIDYINVYQLKWDCDMDETITCQQELDSFDYAVKRSIDISSSSGNVIVRNTDKVTFRVSDSFEITGPFQADSGGEMTVIVQQCPN
jgi:beta-glucanase (GH16 family)